MPFEFAIQRVVEFSETDMAGIVHFSNYFRYMESVEHAFYRSLGFSAMLDKHDPPLGFPRVHVECDYKAPLRFENRLEIRLLVREKRPRVLNYVFRFTNLSGHRPVEVARGAVTVVCVALRPDGTFAPTPIPRAMYDLIEVAPAQQVGA